MMDLPKALREGPVHLRNADDLKARKVPNADALYMWDNQVSALDTFLADTEALAAENGELAALRAKMQGAKKELERTIIAFEATAAGEPVPDDPPLEEMKDDLAGFGEEVLKLARDAGKERVADVKELAAWEDPVQMMNAFLADSEPLGSDAAIGKLRETVRAEKTKLEARIEELVREWRRKDIESGEDEGG